MNKKPKFWSTVLTMGVPFGIFMGLFSWFAMSDSFGSIIFVAVFSGVFFGLGMGLFVKLFSKSKRIEKQVEIELPADERKEFEGPANHFKGIEGRGGKLYLTDKNLHFIPHSFNFQRSKVHIPITEIDEVFHSKTYGLIPNGLTVKTKEKTHRFVVDKEVDWPKRISDQLAVCSQIKAF